MCVRFVINFICRLLDFYPGLFH